MHQQVPAGEFGPLLAQRPGYAQHVVAPRSCTRLRQVIEIEFEIAGKFLGVNYQFAIRPGGNRHKRRKAEGCGHHKAVGGAEGAGLSAKPSFEE